MPRNKRPVPGRGRLCGGFTILELVVTIAIFVVVSTITLANYPGYNDLLALELRAQDVALLARQAQSVALGVRPASIGGSPLYKGYGLHFDVNNPLQIVFFGDQDEDMKYDTGELLEIYELPANFRLNSLCGSSSGGGACQFVSMLDIGFTRPNPEETFAASPPNSFGVSEIEIQSVRSSRKMKVVIYSTGQISVQDVN